MITSINEFRLLFENIETVYRAGKKKGKWLNTTFWSPSKKDAESYLQTDWNLNRQQLHTKKINTTSFLELRYNKISDDHKIDMYINIFGRSETTDLLINDPTLLSDSDRETIIKYAQHHNYQGVCFDDSNYTSDDLIESIVEFN